MGNVSSKGGRYSLHHTEATTLFTHKVTSRIFFWFPAERLDFRLTVLPAFQKHCSCKICDQQRI
jgi:hypothetical protein